MPSPDTSRPRSGAPPTPSLLRHPATRVVIVILVAAVLWWGWSIDGTEGSPARQWYFDLNTQRLFTAPIATMPPIESPSGPFQGAPAGVRAVVVRERSTGAQRIVYLQTMAPEVQDGISRRGPDQDQQDTLIGHGMLVARPPGNPGEPLTWHWMDSPAGQQVSAELGKILGSGLAVPDLP